MHYCYHLLTNTTPYDFNNYNFVYTKLMEKYQPVVQDRLYMKNNHLESSSSNKHNDLTSFEQ